MLKRIVFASAGFVFGFFVGGSFGVAGFGDAVSGAWVFSFCFAAIGWFFATSAEASRISKIGIGVWERFRKQH